MVKHRRRARLGAPPPFWVAKVRLRCPDGNRVVKVGAPLAAEAIRRGVALPPGRCVKEGIELVRR
jgi:hypothetical protein